MHVFIILNKLTFMNSYLVKYRLTRIFILLTLILFLLHKHISKLLRLHDSLLLRKRKHFIFACACVHTCVSFYVHTRISWCCKQTLDACTALGPAFVCAGKLNWGQQDLQTSAFNH